MSTVETQQEFYRIQKLPRERGHDLIPFAIRLLGRCLAKKGMLAGRDLGKQRVDDGLATFHGGQFDGRGKAMGQINDEIAHGQRRSHRGAG